MHDGYQHLGSVSSSTTRKGGKEGGRMTAENKVGKMGAKMKRVEKRGGGERMGRGEGGREEEDE